SGRVRFRGACNVCRRPHAEGDRPGRRPELDCAPVPGGAIRAPAPRSPARRLETFPKSRRPVRQENRDIAGLLISKPAMSLFPSGVPGLPVQAPSAQLPVRPCFRFGPPGAGSSRRGGEAPQPVLRVVPAKCLQVWLFLKSSGWILRPNSLKTWEIACDPAF